eukprot:553701_1
MELFVFVCIIQLIASASIDKLCGNGNLIKEIVFSFHKWEGKLNDEMLWNDKTMPVNTDSIIWLAYLETNKKIATIGQSNKELNIIKFNEIKTSIGYVCKQDGLMGISIGNPNKYDVIIGFQEIWNLDINRKHTLRYNTKNNGKLTLSIYLYTKCQTKCQRQIEMNLIGKSIHGIRYREMDIISFNGGSNDKFDIGKSCELNAPIRIYTSEFEQLWNFDIVSIDELKWKKGKYTIYSNVELELGDRNNICGFLGEDNASLIIILSIISIVLIILFLIYLQIRGKIYNFEQWSTIQAQLNKMENRGYGINDVVIVAKEFNANEMDNKQNEFGMEYVSVNIGQTVSILQIINEEYVKVKVNGIRVNNKNVIGIIPNKCL